MLKYLIKAIVIVEKSPAKQVDTPSVFTTEFFRTFNVGYLFEKRISIREIRKLKILNMLPALVFAGVLAWILLR